MSMPVLACLLAVALVGCGGAQTLDADMPPGCRTEDLGTLTAAYAGELVYVCREYPSLEACPLELQDPVHDRYERRFDDWEHCKTLGKPRAQ